MAFDHRREAVFDQMAEEWDKRVPAPPPEVIARFLDILDLAGKEVLDVGAGTGVLAGAALALRPARWVCCDLSTKMLARAEVKWGDNPAFRTLHADAHNLPLACESFDVVVCNGVLPHFENRRMALAELARVLRPGGLLAVNHFIGRRQVNEIHASSASEVLHSDLLPPVEEISRQLQGLGFEILTSLDTDTLYRIIACKQNSCPEARDGK